MRRSTPILILLTLSGVLLGCWMALDGLHLRLFGGYLTVLGIVGTWRGVPEALGLSPEELAWPTLVLGLTWFGALTGVWLGQRWGAYTVTLLAVLALLSFGPAAMLALAALVCLGVGKLWRPLAPPEA